MKPKEIDPCILSPAQAAQYLGVSRSTLYELREDASFPKALQIRPGRVGFLREEIDGWIAGLAARRSAEVQ